MEDFNGSAGNLCEALGSLQGAHLGRELGYGLPQLRRSSARVVRKSRKHRIYAFKCTVKIHNSYDTQPSNDDTISDAIKSHVIKASRLFTGAIAIFSPSGRLPLPNPEAASLDSQYDF